MRRLSRIQRPIGLLRNHSNTRIPSPYLCLACKHTTSFSTTSRVTVPSNEKIPYTEKIRQRIWGTDKPPGQKDPYGNASLFDRSKKRAPEQELEARNQDRKDKVEQSSKEEFVDDGGYEPATSIEGLKFVGEDPVWEPEEDFMGFLPHDLVRSPARITASTHRAMVEVFGLQQIGVPLYVVSALPIHGDGRWTDNTQLIPSPTGATLRMEDLSSLQEAIESLRAQASEEENFEAEPTESEEDVAADRSEEDPLAAEDETRYENTIASWDPTWLQISLQNPEVKFAVLKRTLQLTGLRPADADLKSTNTAKSLLKHLVTPPKPRSLVEALQQKGGLFDLENVTVRPKRYGFYEKEEDLGRLKIIKKELEARGLPFALGKRRGVDFDQ